MPELLGLPFSPWSEKARWALEARGIAYRARTYQPLLGEPALRVKLRRWSGIVSVPVLTDDDGTVIPDSGGIARWADVRGTGPVLFPPGQDAAVAGFIALSDRGLAAGRALSLCRLLDDAAGVAEMVPRALRGVPGTLAIARAGLRRTLRKYRGAERDAARTELVVVLDELRAKMRPALLGAFSFADIAMAQVVAFISPPASGLRLGAATRRSFTDDDLRSRYADVVAWRDAVYAEYRGDRAR